MDHSLIFRCTLDIDKFDISIDVFSLNLAFHVMLMPPKIYRLCICRSFLRVSKVTEKIKTRSKPTPSENFNSHPLQNNTSLCNSIFNFRFIYFTLIDVI
jgi:hypothetical protein